MADILCRITCFLHRADCQCFNQIFFRFIMYFIQQTVQVAGDIDLTAAFRFHLITEAADKGGKILQFIRIGQIVDTVDKRFLCLSFRHFTYKFCYCTVRQQHKFFNQFVGIFRFLDISTDRFSGFVNFKPYFKAVEVNGSVLKTFFTQLLCQCVQDQYFVFIITFACFDHQLRLFVGEAAVALDHGTSDTRLLHVGLFVQFKNSGEA